LDNAKMISNLCSCFTNKKQEFSATISYAERPLFARSDSDGS